MNRPDQIILCSRRNVDSTFEILESPSEVSILSGGVREEGVLIFHGSICIIDYGIRSSGYCNIFS